jgi:peptidoglycan-associated lipoprotein
MKIVGLATAMALVFGCSHEEKKKPTTPTVDTKPVKKDEPAKPPPNVTGDQKVSPGISVSADLAQLCGIKPAGQVAGSNPKFDYDKDELTSDDRAVLDQIATCLTSGALKGKAVALIGRADPRGTEEYNLGLGSRRAHSVSQYLGRLGVGEPQMAVTTRGAIDATGTDEAGWREDRRVDVQLKQPDQP